MHTIHTHAITRRDTLHLPMCARCCSALDVDGSHRVSYTEFLAAALQRKNYLRVDRIREAFERLAHPVAYTPLTLPTILRLFITRGLSF